MKYKMLVSAMVLALVAGPSFGENRTTDGENGKRQVAVIQTADLKKEKSDTAAINNKEEQNKNVAVEKLIPINTNPLQEEDFFLSKISLGDSIDKIVQLKGKAKKTNLSFLRSEYQWEGLVVTINNKMPYGYSNRDDLSLKNNMDTEGIVSFYVNGKSAVTKRGISVESTREDVIRAYGKPDKILWNRKAQQFYLFYQKEKKALLFIIKNDKVHSFEITCKDDLVQNFSHKSTNNKNVFSEKDFSLAGFKLFESLKPELRDMWEKKMINPEEEILYFPGYAVRTTKKEKIIQSIFLTDKKVITGRGLAVGDDITTAELLYGAPDKMELDVSSGHPRTSYIYFSKDKRNVLIIFINKQKVDSIILAPNPQLKNKK